MGASATPDRAPRLQCPGTRYKYVPPFYNWSYSDPYRLYNAAVFEYLADSSVALYGGFVLQQRYKQWFDGGQRHGRGRGLSLFTFLIYAQASCVRPRAKSCSYSKSKSKPASEPKLISKSNIIREVRLEQRQAIQSRSGHKSGSKIVQNKVYK